jgi:hypothetical protein
MSVIIVFPNGTDWFNANWVFRLAQDVSSRYGNDADLCKALEVAEALGGLDLKKMDDGLRKTAMEALGAVARDTLNGTISGWRPDVPKEHAKYCEAVSELAKLIEDQRNTQCATPLTVDRSRFHSLTLGPGF